MNTEEYLVERFGLLMSISDVADLLGRSPDGIRVSLYTDTEVSRKLKPTMVKVGRRVYFRTLQVKDALCLDSPKENQQGFGREIQSNGNYGA
ncbi:plasmid-related protein [Halomonas daqingensis]|uniref:Plasmid-related protein n=1 Tax=Billgrantia desiderata TaxID=52021 RepID=A0AAW4YN46_9GAMM|nr:plasmid-related protein [Halomonas desiderata]MCE8050091.1 plasmid-related protein [Halomonas desiderata]